MQGKMREHISLWDSEPEMSLKSFGWSDGYHKQISQSKISFETSVVLCANMWAMNCLLGELNVYQNGAWCQK